jgi:3-dehydroquinate synthase
MKEASAPISFINNLKDITALFSFEKYSQCIILVDENTKAHCLPLLINATETLAKAKVVEIISGEANKNFTTCEKVWQQLFEWEIDRNALLINLGGGVISDMGGFIASLYKRGIDFVNIPTTLLAMVDATAGGKTGIDFNAIKNGIGLFKESQHIFIYTEFLNTLPHIELLSGYAEVVKHALIAEDSSYWHEVKQIQLISPPPSKNAIQQIIQKSVALKQSITQADYKETGLRKVLNLGHTIGHALESFALKNNQPIPHGYAVAWGIIAELRLAEKVIDFPEAQRVEIENYLLNIYHNQLHLHFNYSDLIPFLKNDKKNIQLQINFTLLQQTGKPVYNIACNEQDVKKAIDYLAEIL